MLDRIILRQRCQKGIYSSERESNGEFNPIPVEERKTSRCAETCKQSWLFDFGVCCHFSPWRPKTIHIGKACVTMVSHRLRMLYSPQILAKSIWMISNNQCRITRFQVEFSVRVAQGIWTEISPVSFHFWDQSSGDVHRYPEDFIDHISVQNTFPRPNLRE
jgi:hypothetical protein